jgi:AcrR family transcriptional regulator
VTEKTQPRTPASERILSAASELFYQEGIRAVGVDAISEEAGVTKKTLYEKFGSKDELVAAYLRARDERWREWLTGFVNERGGDSPKEKLLCTFDGLGEWMERENLRGCGFVNAYSELADPGHPARVAVLEQKQWLRSYLERLASEAGAGAPKELAGKLLILHEGATITSSMGLVTDAAHEARQTAAAFVAGLKE